MVRRHHLYFLCLIFISLLLWGCPKKVEITPPERLELLNPVQKLLDHFSASETLQAKASIRIETLREGEEMNFLLNGALLYQRPDKFRLLGYHPLGMGIFDFFYREGEFFLLIPSQKKAYAGEVSQLQEVMARAGEIRVSSEKTEGGEIPNRIQIELVEKEARIDLKLKEVSLNPPLPDDAFKWNVPDGVEVRPIDRLLKGKKRR
jgi:outer membrane lipoprotein-sorting protein